MSEVVVRSEKIVMVNLSDINLNPKNRNKHPKEQIDQLVNIIKYQGFRRPVTISNRTGHLSCGEGRYLAAKKLKMTAIPAIYQDYDSEEQEYADGIADNAIDKWADLDLSSINNDITDLGPDFDISLLGIKGFEIDVADKYDEETEDEVPEHVEPKTKLGDIYKLGNHRLMCGDSTNINHVESLILKNPIHLILTDPPYGMSAVSKSGVLSKRYGSDIIGDDNTNAARDSFNLCVSMFPEVKQIWWGANYYSSFLPDSECWIVWDKNNGQSDQTDCELAWTNFRSVVRQFTQASEKKNRVHPTQKPVSLIEWCFEKFKFTEQNVLDLFGGSGSTLIGCEKTGKKSFIMELDPKFADIIVARWEKYTGQKSELING